MSECNRGTPLTKGAREGLCEEARRVWGTRFQRFSADTIFDFEATVAALEAELATSRIDAIGSDDSASYEHGVAIEAEERVAALEAELDGCRSGSAMWEDGARYESKKRADAEAEVERLTPLAEVGEAVEAFPRGWSIGHSYDGETYEVWNDRSKRLSKKPTALAALRAAKGEK